VHRRTFLSTSVFAGAGALGLAVRIASGTERMKLRVSAGRHVSMNPLYVAFESGYFTEAGFDVELVKDIGMAQSVPLLAGGKIDAGFTGFEASVVNAIIRGARLRLVAAREVLSPSCGTAGTLFVSQKAFPSGIQKMRQLQGARIGINNSSLSAFWLDTLLQNEGMRRTDVEVRKMRESERVLALRAGGLDGFLSSESDFSPELRPLGLLPGPRVAPLLPNFEFSYITFGRTLLESNVETGGRFLRAYFRGLNDYLHGKTPHFLEDYAKSNNLDFQLLRSGCRQTSTPDGKIHLNDLRRVIHWMSDQDLCPANVDAATVVDSRYLEAAAVMK
jgi:NitT/TauT family transport system substrate-binding protein